MKTYEIPAVKCRIRSKSMKSVKLYFNKTLSRNIIYIKWLRSRSFHKALEQSNVLNERESLTD